ncbi:tetratricopeptide repeat protein [Desulfonema magnum]|nr:tetratricopeptide repeat protein [Desulfonema magnum]
MGRITRYTVFQALCLLSFLCIAACTEDSKTLFQQWDQKGDEHFKQRKYEAALGAWKEALKIYPRKSEIYIKIAKTYLRMDYPSEAAEAFHKVVASEPDAWEVWLELAKIQLAFLDVETAEESWQRACRGGDTSDTHIFHGDLMSIKNQPDAAEADYRQALSIEPASETAMIRLAVCCLVQGKTEPAEAVYERLASRKPDATEILLEMSNYWELRGTLKEAEAYLLKAVQSDPENIRLRRMLAEFYFNSDSYEKARVIMDKLIKKNPANRFMKKFLVEILLAQNQMPAAQLILDQLSKEREDDLELHLLKGKYFMLTRAPSYAVSHFLAALEKDPGLPVSHYFLGLAYLAGGQISLARERMIKVLTTDPYFSEADLALADIRYKEKAFDASLEHARRIYEREPENVRSHLMMGNVFLAQGRYDSAILRFEAARRLSPDMAAPLYYKALIAELSNYDEKALEIYEALLEQHPDLADASMRYAQLLIRTGDIEMAKLCVEEAVKEMPQNGFLHHILGQVYLVLDETEKAKTHFEQAVSAEPELAAAYLRLAEIYKNSQDQENMIRVLKACITNLPNFPKAYIELADAYRQKMWFKEAADTLETAMTRNPDSPYLANNLAWLFLERDTNADKALKLARFASERLPKDGGVTDTLGWAYYKNNTVTQAILTLTEARSLEPEHPLIHFHLGMALYASGKMPDATERLKHALELGLENPEREHAKKHLRQLRGQPVPGSLSDTVPLSEKLYQGLEDEAWE